MSVPPEIYVVDDDDAVRQAIIKKLARRYRVKAFESGKALLYAIEDKNPDLIVLDLTMPDMNGLEVLEKIKAKDGKARVVILTAYASDGDVQRARGLGVQDFVIKSVELSNLDLIIQRALTTSRGGHG